jgi:hypothetical protein
MTPERPRLTGAPLRASVQRNLTRGPTVRSFRAKAKTHALEALEALASLAQGAASEAVRVSAANALLDRAYGKPMSGVRAALKPKSGEDGEEVELELQWLDGTRS